VLFAAVGMIDQIPPASRPGEPLDAHQRYHEGRQYSEKQGWIKQDASPVSTTHGKERLVFRTPLGLPTGVLL